MVVVKPGKASQEHGLSWFEDKGFRFEWLFREKQPKFIGVQQVDQLQREGIKL